MSFVPPQRFSKQLVCLGTAGLLGLSALVTPAPTQAQPWGSGAYAQPPRWGAPAPYPSRRPQAPYGGSGHPWAPPAPDQNTVYDSDPAAWQTTEAQMAQRCNLGRLVGGLIGGGVGYATSRQDGRSWAVPLGALLGSQMGCNVGAGRGPTPW